MADPERTGLYTASAVFDLYPDTSVRRRSVHRMEARRSVGGIVLSVSMRLAYISSKVGRDLEITGGEGLEVARPTTIAIPIMPGGLEYKTVAAADGADPDALITTARDAAMLLGAYLLLPEVERQAFRALPGASEKIDDQVGMSSVVREPHWPKLWTFDVLAAAQRIFL